MDNTSLTFLIQEFNVFQKLAMSQIKTPHCTWYYNVILFWLSFCFKTNNQKEGSLLL